jgi:hypothetical protein
MALLTPEQIKSVYGTLEQASQITGIPVQQPTQPPQTTTIPMDVADASAPPTYQPPAPPDDLSLKMQLEQNRKAVEEAYQKQLDQINKQLEESKKREAEFRSQADTTLKKAEPLTSPFREGIEKSERERLKVEENFFANQSLTNELDKLLSESIEMTRKLQTQRVPGLAGLQQSERMVKAQQNVQGRIAVIEAVMAARNNQIGVAQGFIDRTLNNIQADRQDRLSYLNNLFNWYETQRTEEGKKIFNLTQEQKGIINSQIGLLENDLAQAERSAQLIKDIMLEDPKMASESGISLSDTETEIAGKIAKWQYNTEVREIKNTAEEKGLKSLTPDEAARYSSDRVFTQIDSKGVERQFLLPEAQADWDLKTIGGSLYRVDAQTGARELLIGGGTTRSGTTPGDTKNWQDTETGETYTDREYARKLAKDEIEKNPNITDAQLYSMIRDALPKLNITDVNKEIANARTESVKKDTRTDLEKATEAFQKFKDEGNDRERALNNTLLKVLSNLNYTPTQSRDIIEAISAGKAKMSDYLSMNVVKVIEEALESVYGPAPKGWWQKFIEWGTTPISLKK